MGRRDPLPFLRKAFETVGMAKVSTSAKEARELGFLRPRPDHPPARLPDPGREEHVLAMNGKVRDAFAAQVPCPGGSPFRRSPTALHDESAGQISEHDENLARKIAFVDGRDVPRDETDEQSCST